MPSRIPDKFYRPLNMAILESNFWLEANDSDSADYNTIEGEDVDQTPAAEVLSRALTVFFKESGYLTNVLVRSPDPENNPNSAFGKSHASYPDKIIIGGEMGLSSRGRRMLYLNLATYMEDFDVNDITPQILAAEAAETIRHELIHSGQYDKRSQAQKVSRVAAKESYYDEGQISSSENREQYLSAYIEIDAYAHEFAEYLLRNYGKQKALNIIKKPKGLNNVKLPDQMKEYLDGVSSKKAYINLLKKIYFHINDLFDRKLIENVLKRLMS